MRLSIHHRRAESAALLASAKDEDAQPELEQLDERMHQFYNSPITARYFECAEAENVDWGSHPYHRAIREQVHTGMEVLDFGCGSGHALRNLRHRGISYTGLDWSSEQIEVNTRRYGKADGLFLATSLYRTELPDESFDLVFSTYVIEHLVWPHRFLREMIRLLRPGGVGIVLAPEYRSRGHMPSFYYGLPIAPLKEKLGTGKILSASRHAYAKYVEYPRFLRMQYPLIDFPFLINLRPTCLLGSYYPDNDAVYCVDSDEVSRELLRLGTTDITGEVLVQEPSLTRREGDTCFVAVRKSASAAVTG